MRNVTGAKGEEAEGVFRVRVWGARGSLPVSGQEFHEFGGNTICVEMRCGNEVLLFDAGSGLVPAGRALCAEGVKSTNLFFSHCHYDHVIGFPFFSMMFDRDATIDVWSGHLNGTMTTYEMVSGFMRRPYFPVDPDVYAARLNSNEFLPGDVLRPCADVTIKTAGLNHPGGAIGYRVEWAGRSVAVITDTEHVVGELDPAVLGLIEGCDLFFYDSTYTEEEIPQFRGYGHSTWQHAIGLAKASGAKQVGFFHHATWRTDSDLNAIDRAAKLEFPGAFVARDGQLIDI
ncbi:MAG: MBL fold metallo-hydrolase [Albidovulum sp.]